MVKFAWKDPNHYGIPTVVAIVAHGLIIISLWAGWWTGWASEKPIRPEPIPKNMTARVIQTENSAVKKREQQRLEQQREKQRLKEARRKAAKEKAAKEKAAKEKAAKEKAAKEKAAKEKAAKEKAAKEKAAKEKAAKEKAAKEKAAKEKAAKEKAAQRQRQQQIRAQESARAMDLIRQQVGDYWQFPPNVRGDEEVTLQVVCVPTGQVISVTVVNSSGNTALDRSVEQAVYKASPLPVPEDIVLFEQNFRSFKIKFRPENAEW